MLLDALFLRVERFLNGSPARLTDRSNNSFYLPDGVQNLDLTTPFEVTMQRFRDHARQSLQRCQLISAAWERKIISRPRLSPSVAGCRRNGSFGLKNILQQAVIDSAEEQSRRNPEIDRLGDCDPRVNLSCACCKPIGIYSHGLSELLREPVFDWSSRVFIALQSEDWNAQDICELGLLEAVVLAHPTQASANLLLPIRQ